MEHVQHTERKNGKKLAAGIALLLVIVAICALLFVKACATQEAPAPGQVAQAPVESIPEDTVPLAAPETPVETIGDNDVPLTAPDPEPDPEPAPAPAPGPAPAPDPAPEPEPEPEPEDTSRTELSAAVLKWLATELGTQNNEKSVYDYFYNHSGGKKANAVLSSDGANWGALICDQMETALSSLAASEENAALDLSALNTEDSRGYFWSIQRNVKNGLENTNGSASDFDLIFGLLNAATVAIVDPATQAPADMPVNNVGDVKDLLPCLELPDGRNDYTAEQLSTHTGNPENIATADAVKAGYAVGQTNPDELEIVEGEIDLIVREVSMAKGDNTEALTPLPDSFEPNVPVVPLPEV